MHGPIHTENCKIKKNFKLILGAPFIVSVVGAFELLLLAAYGALNTFVGVFLLSFSEEHVPYVACSDFVLYYIWSSYSSFKKEFQELALALYDCYKDSKRTQLQDVPSTPDQLLKLTRNTDDLDNVIAISKELFQMACEEHSPLREGVCKLILKITAISFVFIVFSLAMVFRFDTTPLMKTLLTFLTLESPKIVAIYIGGGWQKYIYIIYITTRGKRDTNADSHEVILVNEDYIELAIM